MRVRINGKALRKKQRTLIEHTEPKVTRAFLADIQAVCDDALMNSLAEAIAGRDMDDVFAVLGIDEAIFDNYRATMNEAFRQSGNLVVEALPALRTVDG